MPVQRPGSRHGTRAQSCTAASDVGGGRLSKTVGLDAEQTANAIAGSAADNVSLATVHAEPVSNWKGISPAITGMRAVYTTMLAGRGVTGPKSLFEGPHGLVQLFDQQIDFHTAERGLTAVEQTYLKQYRSLIHGQAIIDTVLAIRGANDLRGEDVERVTLEVFQGAYDFAGGGAYGDKSRPWTKEQADYNLKYLSAVALLDGAVGPEQLDTERVRRADVQELLTRVDVKPAADLTAGYPQRTAARVHVVTRDGREFSREETDYEGSPTRPLSWDRVVEKFHWLAEPFCTEGLRADIVAAVDHLDEITTAELTALLGAASPIARRPRSRHRF